MLNLYQPTLREADTHTTSLPLESICSFEALIPFFLEQVDSLPPRRSRSCRAHSFHVAFLCPNQFARESHSGASRQLVYFCSTTCNSRVSGLREGQPIFRTSLSTSGLKPLSFSEERLHYKSTIDAKSQTCAPGGRRRPPHSLRFGTPALTACS